MDRVSWNPLLSGLILGLLLAKPLASVTSSLLRWAQKKQQNDTEQQILSRLEAAPDEVQDACFTCPLCWEFSTFSGMVLEQVANTAMCKAC